MTEEVLDISVMVRSTAHTYACDLITFVIAKGSHRQLPARKFSGHEVGALRSPT